MKLGIVANTELENAFLSRTVAPGTDMYFVDRPDLIPTDADAVFDLLFENTAARIDALRTFLPRPIFINAVTDTLVNIAQPFIRINAWPGFLERNTLEISASPAQLEMAKNVLESLQWRYTSVPDIIGMVSTRIISMIINEAYFTLQDETSTREEIDIAMITGTHYPYGPFEWSRKIGLSNVHHLLSQLARTDDRYEVSTLLAAEAIAPEINAH